MQERQAKHAEHLAELETMSTIEKKAATETQELEVPGSPLTKGMLKQVGPLQVELMLESEVQQIEKYYDDKKLSRKLGLALPIQRQVLTDEGQHEEGSLQKKGQVCRYGTHIIQTDQCARQDTINDGQFQLARGQMGQGSLCRAYI